MTPRPASTSGRRSRSGSGWWPATPRSSMTRDDARLVDARPAGAARRGGLRLPPRRRPRAPARPPVAAPARGPARPLAHRRPRGVRLGRRRLAGQGARGRRSSTSCTSGRSRPEGTLDAAAEQARPPGRPRRRVRRADAGQLLRRHPQLGLRRRRLVRGRRDLRRPGGLPALRRRMPRRRARRRPGRRLQPPRARRATTCRCSGPTSRPAATPGATWSTWTARGRPRCAATSSTTSGCGSRTTTSTASGSTPCTRCRTPRRCTCWRRWPPRSRRCRPGSAGR